MSLILASSSAIRRAMLDAAGVPYRAIPTDLDEAGFKGRLDDPVQLASELAKAKALQVAASQPADWIVGSDSVVEVAGRLFDKPGSRGEAAEHLRLFSGKPMQLTSAVALCRGSSAEWAHSETATLHVRTLSDGFIESYLDAEWPRVGHCVGVFRLEGRGVQLFDRIEGDHFTILGMPLIPLLGALRDRGVLAA